MSGASNDPTGNIPEELHILAGEYVLGVLDPLEMRAVRRRAQQDTSLGAAIAGWERRLAPLADIVPAAAPPPALWARLERGIAELPEQIATDAPSAAAAAVSPGARANPLRPRDPPPPERPLPELRAPEPEGRLPPPRATATIAPLVPRVRGQQSRRSVWPWQLATVGSLALAAGLAAVVFVPSVALRVHLGTPAPQVAALTSAEGQTSGFLAEAMGNGSVMLTALSPMTVPSGHDMELWILRPGSAVPASLGVLPPGGRTLTLASLPAAGTQLLVSLEPPGGSPTGAPTGPVLYKGTLAQLSL